MKSPDAPAPHRARARSAAPVLAIGGLNATRAAEVLAAGPVGIAVMGGVMCATDPGER
jgi:thiamine monophosphate synthase